MKGEKGRTREEKVKEILIRGVEDVIVRENLEKKLNSGVSLRIKLGIDPTSPDLHLGHAVVLRKLRAFQDLGHQAVLIIGDFTATIGDPTGKSTTRPPLDEETIEKNMEEYISQAGKIIDIERAEIRYNGEWLKKLSFSEIFKLSGLISVTQMLERNDFSSRIKNQQSIRMHELFYPLMQAYDSVAVKSDVELGGNDQLFNNLTGRTLMEKLNLIPQDILTVSLLLGTDGKEKMSKSVGNYIALKDSHEDMFGKIMSIPDSSIINYFKLCTDIELEEIEKIEKEINRGANPRDLKIRLAKEIVTIYHGEKKANDAEENFINTFSKGGIPEGIGEDVINRFAMLDGLLLEKAIVKSKGEFKRLIDEGAVSDMETGEKVTEYNFKIEKDTVFKIGKRRFLKVRVQ